MTTEATIFSTLTGLVGGRCYPDVQASLPARPYIVYQQIAGQAVNFYDLAIPSKKNGRYQVSVFADTRLAAIALAKQVEDALRVVASLNTEVIGAATWLSEEGPPVLYGSRQDFSCWG